MKTPLGKYISGLSIKSRMIITLGSLLFTGFIITGYMNYRSSHATVRENLINSILPLTSDNIYTEMEKELIRPVFISSMMANDTFLKDWVLGGEENPETVKNYLITIKNKYKFFSVFFVSSKTGNYYHYNGILKKISREDSHDVWYYNFINLKTDYDLIVDTDEAADHALTIFINHRLKDYRGNLLGVTGVGLHLEKVSDLLQSAKERYGSDIYLVNRAGIIQARSGKKHNGNTDIRKQNGLRFIADNILGNRNDTTIYEFNRDGGHILLNARYIPEFKWYLFVEINERSKMMAILKNIVTTLLIGLMISAIIIAISIFTINHYQNKLSLLAVTDELTGAFNRREFSAQFRKAVYSFSRNASPFSIIIFDIDCFKRVNDLKGHTTGDHVIRNIAFTAKKEMRQNDIFVRWGGDEFIIITYCDEESALLLAERIRISIGEFMHKTALPGEKGIKVTISCGVSQYASGDTMDAVIMRADRALYKAKSGGRNRSEKFSGIRG